MQSLNLTSHTNDKLQDLAHKILEMEQMSIYIINSMSAKLKAYPLNFWSSVKVKTFSTMGTLISALGIIALAIGLYCECFQNKMGCVCKDTKPTTLPNKDEPIELQPITNPMSEISDQLSPKLVQEILKASGVDISTFEYYKKCKALHHISTQSTEVRGLKTILKEFPYGL